MKEEEEEEGKTYTFILWSVHTGDLLSTDKLKALLETPRPTSGYLPITMFEHYVCYNVGQNVGYKRQFVANVHTTYRSLRRCWWWSVCLSPHHNITSSILGLPTHQPIVLPACLQQLITERLNNLLPTYSFPCHQRVLSPFWTHSYTLHTYKIMKQKLIKILITDNLLYETIN